MQRYWRYSSVLLAVALSLLGTGAGDTLSVCTAGCPFSSIQAAVDAAVPGDDVEVRGGTYNENVNVTKRLHLVGVGMPVIDAGSGDSAMDLHADGTVVEGFEIRNSPIESSSEKPASLGIVVHSRDNVVKKNAFDGAWQGVSLINTRGNSVTDNTITRAEEGLYLLNSDSNFVSKNNISRCEDGLVLEKSSQNVVSDNHVSYCSDDGIVFMDQSEGNTVSGNRAIGNGWHGLEITISDLNEVKRNFATNNGVCNILVLDSNKNSIEDNVASFGTKVGIVVSGSDKNVLIGNSACENNVTGIFLEDSDDNMLVDCEACGNGVNGLWLLSSAGNQLYGNNLADNAVSNAYDDGMNHWDDGSKGNHYDDYDRPAEGCKDENFDGICDSGYEIEGGTNVDRYPLRSGS